MIIRRRATDHAAEPYVYYDGRDPSQSGWVLRYSLGLDRHIDEPLDLDADEDATDEEILAVALPRYHDIVKTHG